MKEIKKRRIQHDYPSRREMTCEKCGQKFKGGITARHFRKCPNKPEYQNQTYKTCQYCNKLTTNIAKFRET